MCPQETIPLFSVCSSVLKWCWMHVVKLNIFSRFTCVFRDAYFCVITCIRCLNLKLALLSRHTYGFVHHLRMRQLKQAMFVPCLWNSDLFGRVCSVWRRWRSFSWIVARRTRRAAWRSSSSRSSTTPANLWGCCWASASSTCRRRSPCRSTNISSEFRSVPFVVISAFPCKKTASASSTPQNTVFTGYLHLSCTENLEHAWWGRLLA